MKRSLMASKRENQQEFNALKESVKVITEENEAIKAENMEIKAAIIEIRKTILLLTSRSNDTKHLDIKNEMIVGTLGGIVSDIKQRTKGWR